MSTWVSRWLQEYLIRKGSSEEVAETTFLYLLVGGHLGEPDGTVSRNSGVVEFGSGSDPVGPEDGREVTLLGLVEAVVALLK
ncbi:hypothetical protein [Pseudofrankia sp. BMG5.37]|uniref:hypothetical protein n=1 Tax=Pseudofrankia sp. BMG5.37 TaxID=3050035 RepID=UPI002894DF59|nr:hypothetical protein [Pseudofrankia sp. BMG5.37]MDT3438188.1 hypothetical protein [Pseudofrankia sp. BMG5.37]